MEITTKVIAHLDHKEGVSKSSGKEWSRDTFLFDNGDGKNAQSFAGDVWNKDIAEWLKANVGAEDMFLAIFKMEARGYNGRYFNSVRVYKVTQNGKDVTEGALTKEENDMLDAALAQMTTPPPTEKEDSEDGQGELPF